MRVRALASAVRLPAAFALAAAVAAAGASYAAQAPHQKAAHVRPAAAVVVRAVAIRGMEQTVHAYVAPDEATYVADFPTRLDVKIVGGKNSKAKRRVKFQCVNPDCHLYAPEQPEGGDRKSPADYEIDVKNGIASLHASIEAAQPAGTYTVYAEPIVKNGERSVRSGPFTLISR